MRRLKLYIVESFGILIPFTWSLGKNLKPPAASTLPAWTALTFRTSQITLLLVIIDIQSPLFHGQFDDSTALWTDENKRTIVHDDVIQWKHFPPYWPFVPGIHRWPANSPHKSQWRGALMLSFICALNTWLSKQSWGWWFDTPSRTLWRHCNEDSQNNCIISHKSNIAKTDVLEKAWCLH